MLTMEIEHVDVDALEAAAKKAKLDIEPTPRTIRVSKENIEILSIG